MLDKLTSAFHHPFFSASVSDARNYFLSSCSSSLFRSQREREKGENETEIEKEREGKRDREMEGEKEGEKVTDRISREITD